MREGAHFFMLFHCEVRLFPLASADYRLSRALKPIIVYSAGRLSGRWRGSLSADVQCLFSGGNRNLRHAAREAAAFLKKESTGYDAGVDNGLIAYLMDAFGQLGKLTGFRQFKFSYHACDFIK